MLIQLLQAPSTHPARATRFPSLRRLGLANVTFLADLITPFVLAFPKLTHLDLTGTRIGPGEQVMIGQTLLIR